MWLICMRSCICLCAGRLSSLFDDFPTSIPWSTLKIRFFLLPVSHNEYMLLLMVSKGDMPPAQLALWIVMLTCASTAVGHSYPAPPLFISILLRFGAVSVCCCWLHVSTLKCRYQVKWYRSREPCGIFDAGHNVWFIIEGTNVYIFFFFLRKEEDDIKTPFLQEGPD
jgi:hypothetical protein